MLYGFLEGLKEVPCKTCEGCVLDGVVELCDLVNCIPVDRPSFILVEDTDAEVKA